MSVLLLPTIRTATSSTCRGAHWGYVPVVAHVMPVEDPDLEAAAAHAYADQLPDSFDLIHLGLGPDGHTRIAGTGGYVVLEARDRLVAIHEFRVSGLMLHDPHLSCARAGPAAALVADGGIQAGAALGSCSPGTPRSPPAGCVRSPRPCWPTSTPHQKEQWTE